MVSQEEHSRAVQPVASSQKRGSAQAGIGRRSDVVEPAQRRRPLDQTGDQGLEVPQIDLSGGVSAYRRPKPVAVGAGFDPRLQPSQNVQHRAMRQAGHADQPATATGCPRARASSSTHTGRNWMPQSARSAASSSASDPVAQASATAPSDRGSAPARHSAGPSTIRAAACPSCQLRAGRSLPPGTDRATAAASG